MDYFDTLLGGDYQDPERMKEIARQLRRQHAYGTLGAMTGDPVLGKVGADMVEGARAKGEGLRKARQAASTARALGEGYYEQGGEIKELPGYQEARERKSQSALKRALEVARVKAQTRAEEFKDQDAYKRSFIPEGTWRGPKGVAQGIAQIEALGGLVNPMMNATDLSSPAADVAAEFLNDIGAGGLVRMAEPTYRSLDTRQLRSSLENVLAKIRNSMFGAALTRYEGGRYEKVSPLAPGLEKDEIIRRTQNLADYLRNEANTLVAGRKTPSGEPMPGFLKEGWTWETPGGSVSKEQESLSNVTTGTKATIKMPPGWKVEVVE